MASAYFDTAAISQVLKEYYDGQVVQNMVWDGCPWLALVSKDESIAGKFHPVPIQTNVGAGGSANFTNAINNQTAPVLKEFLVTQVEDYGVGTLTKKAMLQSRNDAGAFVNAVKLQVDSAIRQVKNSIAQSLYRAGTGSRGQISTISSGVITLVDPETVVSFMENDVLQANATDGGASPRAAKGYVIEVDYDAGTVTVSTTLGGSAASPGSWAANDFLVRDGDNNAKLQGLLGWLPLTAPTTGDLFFNVDRSKNPTMLAGVRFDGSGMPIEEALIKGEARVARQGGNPDICFMNFASYSALKAALGAKAMYQPVEIKGPADISFSGLRLQGVTGDIDVVPDRYCPGSTAFLLQKDTWSLGSMGPAPMIIEYEDGLKFQRVPGADAMEIRVGMYGNLECSAPGFNAVLTLGE